MCDDDDAPPYTCLYNDNETINGIISILFHNNGSSAGCARNLAVFEIHDQINYFITTRQTINKSVV